MIPMKQPTSRATRKATLPDHRPGRSDSTGPVENGECIPAPLRDATLRLTVEAVDWILAGPSQRLMQYPPHGLPTRAGLLEKTFPTRKLLLDWGHGKVSRGRWRLFCHGVWFLLFAMLPVRAEGPREILAQRWRPALAKALRREELARLSAMCEFPCPQPTASGAELAKEKEEA